MVVRVDKPRTQRLSSELMNVCVRVSVEHLSGTHRGDAIPNGHNHLSYDAIACHGEHATAHEGVARLAGAPTKTSPIAQAQRFAQGNHRLSVVRVALSGRIGSIILHFFDLAAPLIDTTESWVIFGSVSGPSDVLPHNRHVNQPSRADCRARLIRRQPHSADRQ